MSSVSAAQPGFGSRPVGDDPTSSNVRLLLKQARLRRLAARVNARDADSADSLSSVLKRPNRNADSQAMDQVDPAIDRLRDEPLMSRTRFFMTRLLFVLGLLAVVAGLLLAFLRLNSGFLKGVAVTILIIPIAIALSMAWEMLFAIPRLLSYKSYLNQWEQANAGADLHGG